jgi:methylated-DNA-protein-cysteine methyltransferase related protein
MVDDASAPFSARVLRMVRLIPYGKVTSYGDVAALLGAPRAARGVGHVLSSLPQGSDVPWWRVVNGRGEISIRHVGGRLQRVLLEQEGVRFGRGGQVDLRTFRWRPPDLDGIRVTIDE